MSTTSDNPDEWLTVPQPQDPDQDLKAFTLPDRPNDYQQHSVTDQSGVTHTVAMFTKRLPALAYAHPSKSPSQGYSRHMNWSINEAGKFILTPESNIWGFRNDDGDDMQVHFEHNQRASTNAEKPRERGAHGCMKATYTPQEVLLEEEDHDPPPVSIIHILIHLLIYLDSHWGV
jgi:hypothetical protein